MRKFYIYFPIATTVSTQLSWSHYLEIIKIEEEAKRNFYIKETINSRWSVRELQRQIGSLLYERLLISSNKNKVLELSEKGHEITESKDLVKDPFVLEFLDIKENTDYLESDLEKSILEHLKEFLLELGKVTDFQAHQIEHQLGAYTDCNHGQGLAIIHPKLHKHIYQANISKFVRFAVEVWKVDRKNLTDEEVAKKGIEKLEEFIKEIGLPTTLTQIGISHKEMLKKVADSSNITKGCAKQLSHEEIYEILLECL